MNQYMALTSNDSATPALFVDTTAPLEVLLDAASYRLQAVTQVLENLALRSEISSDAVVLSDFALLCSIRCATGATCWMSLRGGWTCRAHDLRTLRFQTPQPPGLCRNLGVLFVSYLTPCPSL